MHLNYHLLRTLRRILPKPESSMQSELDTLGNQNDICYRSFHPEADSPGKLGIKVRLSVGKAICVFRKNRGQQQRASDGYKEQCSQVWTESLHIGIFLKFDMELSDI